MGNYQELKDAISDVIKQNGNQQITGQLLQNTLLSIVSIVGANATYAGIATPNTNPGTPDQNVFYIATQKGEYVNFSNYEVKERMCLFVNKNGSWAGVKLGILLDYLTKEHFFVYPRGLFPIITKSGQGSNTTYNVQFKPGTYYVIEKNGLGVGSINYTETQSFDILAGQMLICDNTIPELKVIQQTDSEVTNRTILLNNMRLVSGAFEALIIENIIENTSDIGDIKKGIYKSNDNIITDISNDVFDKIKPLIKCNIFVDAQNINDEIGIGVMENNTRDDQKARFYIYDKTKGYNIVVANINIPEGEPLLKGTTRLLGNYTYRNRINCWIDVVINWDLYNTNITTTSPTIMLQPFEIGSLQYINTFPNSQSKIRDAASEFFTVEVNGEKPNSENGFNGISSDVVANNKQYNDMCHYQQPASNTPLKLLILCHGGGVTVTETVDNWYNYQNIGKIFNALGYAVLLTNGMPRDWAEEKGIGIDRPCGNWMAVQSVVKAYNYVINKYDIDPNGCYVYGQSQGGMVAENIAELSGLPILATILESPAISMKYAQLYIPSALSCLQALYGFNSQETYNKEKCIGLDPLLRNVNTDIIMTGNSVSTLDIDIDTMEQKKYRVNTPILIIRSLADTTISPKLMGAYAKAIINGGGNCKLITYTSAGHSTIASTSVIGTIDGYNVRASLYEIIVFLESNGGYKSDKIILN